MKNRNAREKGKIDPNCKYCKGRGDAPSKEFLKGYDAGRQSAQKETDELKQQLAQKDKELSEFRKSVWMLKIRLTDFCGTGYIAYAKDVIDEIFPDCILKAKDGGDEK